MNDFYIYIYLDPRKSGRYNYGEYEFDYEPFYVGKGKGNRLNCKKNNHCERKINKIKRLGFEPIKIKLRENIEENYSLVLESELINLVGREDLKEGPLTNETDGGEGISGYKYSKEIREIIAEKLRKEYSIIRKEFERRDYELLTKEEDYKSNKQKLEYIHNKCGRKHSICWVSFKYQGCGCPHCGIKEQARKQRKEYSIIKETFENRDYILLTEEKDYKNCDTKLEYIHKKCGNKHSICWSDFQQRKGCPICGIEKYAKKLRKNFSDIKNAFENRNYQLLTEEKDYKNNETRLECICNKCGNKYFTKWNKFQQNRDCSCRAKEKYAKKRRKNFPKIKETFKKKKYELLTEEKDYKNAHQKLDYICPKGHKHSISWTNFQQGRCCPYCYNEKRKISRKLKNKM